MTAVPEMPGEVPEEIYPIETESGAEMARLMRQDRLVTAGMGGIFPEKVDLTGIRDVLDLACGPGGWVMDVALAHPEMQVMGVDISEKMISYAQAQSQVQSLLNTSFQVMNILKPLPFPDASFDLVNERFIVGFVQQNWWKQVISEGLRLLRPGGILRFTEVEGGLTNKFYFEKAWWLMFQAMAKNSMGFSPNGLHMNIISVLPKMFREAGLQNMEKMAHVIDFSAGTEARDGFYYDLMNGFQALGPFVQKSGVATLEEWQDVSQKGLAEMFEDDFCASWTMLTVWGRR